MRKEFVQAVQNNRYERSANGLYLPEHKVMLGGVFSHDVIRDGESLGIQHDHNLVTDEGLDWILDTVFNSTAAVSVTTWYIAIFEGSGYTEAADDDAANIVARSTESTAYDESNRVAYEEGTASSKSIDNSAAKATFTINATKTIYGAFMSSINTKSAGTGTLLAASKFSASRSLVDDDTLLIQYTFTAADA